MEQEIMENVQSVKPRDQEGQKNIFRLFFAWIRQHPVLALCLVFLGVVVAEFLSLPGRAAIQELRTINPPTTALMEARKKDRVREGKSVRMIQRWVPLSEISPDLIHAVIAAEDGAFYEHGGFDWYEVQESLEKNWNEGRVARGGSTMTQQLAKNLYLSTSKDPVRKLKEAYITMQMERLLSKDRILELYLNFIEWGDGMFGVGAAAAHYFGKSAAELSREEAARLAAVIPSPLRHRPNEDSAYVLHRSEIILERMNARGW